MSVAKFHVTASTSVVVPVGSTLELTYRDESPGRGIITGATVTFSGTVTVLLGAMGEVFVDDGFIQAASVKYGKGHDRLLTMQRNFFENSEVFGQLQMVSDLADEEGGAGVWAGNDEPPVVGGTD